MERKLGVPAPSQYDNPTLADVRNRLGPLSPDVVHMAGVDTHEGVEHPGASPRKRAQDLSRYFGMEAGRVVIEVVGAA